MQNSRLIVTLRTLNPPEWRSFHQYLASPFFNQREDVAVLAAFIQKELSKPEAEQSFDKAAVWKKIFPQLTYQEKQLRYVMSYLLRMAADFLVVTEMQNNKAFQQLFSFKSLQKRGFEKSAVEQLITFSNSGETSDDFEPAIYRILQKKRREIMPAQASYTEKMVAQDIEHLTLNMLIEILQEGCSLLEFQTAAQSHLTFPLLEVALHFIEKEPLVSSSPTLLMLYHTFRMLEKMPSGDGAEHFFLLKKVLNRSGEIPTALQRESWLRAINFAIRQQNTGNKIFGKEAFELYQSGIETGLILENGQISKKAYSNTLVLALLVGEWEWAESFLKQYKNYLPEHERDNTYRHNLATLFFKQKQFGKVLETLQHVSFTDSMHNLDDRRLLLCSYYELGEWASLDSLLDSFGIWLRRAKNLGYHRELYANLVRFTRRLLDVQHLQKPVKEKLKADIVVAKNVAAKEWLLEKLT